MGTVLVAECDCGYRSSDLCVGIGMRTGADVFFYPAVCPSCRTIRIGNYALRPDRCGSCSTELEFFTRPLPSLDHADGTIVFRWISHEIPGEAETDFSLAQGVYICPNCGAPTLRFSETGFWD